MNVKLRQELDYFLSGLSFYTRIPCPKSVVYQPENFNKSRRYLALIGGVVGLVAAVVYYLASLALPASVAVLLSMIATIYLTGAFHEDGFADSCDGFGGGWDKAQILTIMKDSRVGTYAVVGLVLILGLKFAALFEFTEPQRSPSDVMMVLVCGHALSRFMASLIMQRYDYVSQLQTSKSFTVTSVRLGYLEMLLSALPVIILLLLAWSVQVVIAVGLVLIVTGLMGEYFKRKIGGYTGDCLGAVQQISEVIFYLACLGGVAFIS